MPKLYSYVVEHDDGFAPNPSGGLCTLAKCKYSKSGRRSVVELAREGDWIIGTGGANLRRSAGKGKLVYAMRVDKKIPLAEYFRLHGKRLDAANDCVTDGRYALLSRHYCYFGRYAVDIPAHLLAVEKDGQNFKSKFSEEFVEEVIEWLETLPRGENGPSCMTYVPRTTRNGCERKRDCGKPSPKRKAARVAGLL